MPSAFLCSQWRQPWSAVIEVILSGAFVLRLPPALRVVAHLQLMTVDLTAADSVADFAVHALSGDGSSSSLKRKARTAGNCLQHIAADEVTRFGPRSNEARSSFRSTVVGKSNIDEAATESESTNRAAAGESWTRKILHDHNYKFTAGHVLAHC